MSETPAPFARSTRLPQLPCRGQPAGRLVPPRHYRSGPPPTSCKWAITYSPTLIVLTPWSGHPFTALRIMRM